MVLASQVLGEVNIFIYASVLYSYLVWYVCIHNLSKLNKLAHRLEDPLISKLKTHTI
jgi:hypothetical protein